MDAQIRNVSATEMFPMKPPKDDDTNIGFLRMRASYVMHSSSSVTLQHTHTHTHKQTQVHGEVGGTLYQHGASLSTIRRSREWCEYRDQTISEQHHENLHSNAWYQSIHENLE